MYPHDGSHRGPDGLVACAPTCFTNTWLDHDPVEHYPCSTSLLLHEPHTSQTALNGQPLGPMNFPLDTFDGHGSFSEIPQHSYDLDRFIQADLWLRMTHIQVRSWFHDSFVPWLLILQLLIDESLWLIPCLLILITSSHLLIRISLTNHRSLWLILTPYLFSLLSDAHSACLLIHYCTLTHPPNSSPVLYLDTDPAVYKVSPKHP
jgi:hypothetical protein